MDETEDNLDSVSSLEGPERAQVVGDIEADLDRLEAAYDLLLGSTGNGARGAHPHRRPHRRDPPPGVVGGRLDRRVGGRPRHRRPPERRPGRPARGPRRPEPRAGRCTPTSPSRTACKAAALSIPVEEALGWLVVAVGGGQGDEDGVGASVRWLGRVAVAAVRLVAKGRIVPSLRTHRHPEGKVMDLNVRWSPARVDDGEITRLAGAMPGPVVGALPQGPAHRHPRGDRRGGRRHRAGGGREARAPGHAAGDPQRRRRRRGLRRPPRRHAVHGADPRRRRGVQAPRPVGAPGERRGQDHARHPARPARHGRRLVPATCSGAAPRAACSRSSRRSPTASARSTSPTRSSGSSGIYDKLGRAGGLRRGQVYLSQDEAWELMTVTGPALEAAGFEVRVPALSRRKPTPALRLFVEPEGRHGRGRQPAQRRALVGGVRRRGAHRRRRRPPGRRGPPAGEARTASGWSSTASTSRRRPPPSPSAPTAERMTGAEILRHVVGLEGTPFGAGLTVEGSGWVTDLLDKASAAPLEADHQARGVRRRAAALPGRGARLARLPRRRRARRLPRPRHGPRQDAHRPRPPRPHRAAARPW